MSALLDSAVLCCKCDGAVAGSWVGCQGQDVMRKERVLFEPEKIEWHGLEPEIVRQGSIIGQSINATRRWINLPANVMDPESLANEAKELAARDGFEFESWDRDKLIQERCGALLGVARGSSRPPRLVILKYRGNDSAAPTVLVGKGVTFDSGGYSIKPTDGMLSMKCDMAGAATVMGIMSAAARLKVPHNLIGILGLVENMISGDAFSIGRCAYCPQWKNDRNSQHRCGRAIGSRGLPQCGFGFFSTTHCRFRYVDRRMRRGAWQ